MKRIAITCENNEVFQHFGRTPRFMIYDVDDNQIINQKEIKNDGVGHSALVNVLQEYNVEVVICGGLGMPMYNHLIEANMEVYPGVTGNVDEVIQDYLDGTLDYDINTPMNHSGCHHHSMMS